MKSKYLIIIVIGLVVLVVGGIFILSSNRKTVAPVVQVPSEEIISTMKPEEIGLSLTASADNRKVIIEVANTKDIVKLDYALSYTKKGDIPIGAMGQPEIKSGQVFRQEVVLGTCSDVCHYDEDVSDIKLILKVVKTDGTTFKVEKSLEL